MKIGFLRKFYPLINKSSKNIKWRPLTDNELDISMKEPQMIANCYDDATRYSLLASTKGRDTFRKRVKIQKNRYKDPAYKINLNIKGKNEVYTSKTSDYFQNFYDIYRNFNSIPEDTVESGFPAKLGLGTSIGISKMISKHPGQKPLISRLYLWPFFENRNCEFNKPSNAFRWYTGIEPTTIGESGLNQTLKQHKEEAIQTLEQLGESSNKDYSFVAISGGKKPKNGAKWHCYPILNVDKNNRNVTVLNKRTNENITMSFDKVVETFKSLVGINWKSQG